MSGSFEITGCSSHAQSGHVEFEQRLLLHALVVVHLANGDDFANDLHIKAVAASLGVDFLLAVVENLDLFFEALNAFDEGLELVSSNAFEIGRHLHPLRFAHVEQGNEVGGYVVFDGDEGAEELRFESVLDNPTNGRAVDRNVAVFFEPKRCVSIDDLRCPNGANIPNGRSSSKASTKFTPPTINANTNDARAHSAPARYRAHFAPTMFRARPTAHSPRVMMASQSAQLRTAAKRQPEGKGQREVMLRHHRGLKADGRA